MGTGGAGEAVRQEQCAERSEEHIDADHSGLQAKGTLSSRLRQHPESPEILGRQGGVVPVLRAWTLWLQT